jgi:PD-(D/E)XK endonuclease
MRNQGTHIRHPKARGEWAELRFMTRACELGLRVSKPWGDSAPYDVAVEHNGRFLRVQVKCTCKKRLHSYVCSVSNSRGPYTSDQIDFIAAYVIPADTWYILPLAALHHSFDVWLTPYRKNSHYAEFKEAWHLLKK